MPARYEPTTYDYDYSTGKAKAVPREPTTVTTARLTDAELATLDELTAWMEETQTLGRYGRYTRSASIKQLIAWWRQDRAPE